MGAAPDASGEGRVHSVIEPTAETDLEILLGQSGPRRSPEYLAWKRRRAKELLERAMERAPDLGSGAELLEAVTPASYRDWTGTFEGAIYGPKRSLRSVPLTMKTPVRGLYLSGQGLLSPGIIGAASSGILAAGEVVGQQAAWEVLEFR
jgi:all-trans-retinol 13,14-reductase